MHGDLKKECENCMVAYNSHLQCQGEAHRREACF